MLLLKLQSYAARPRIICMRVRPVPLGLTRTAAHPGDIDARHGPGVGGMHMTLYRRRETRPIKHNPACWSCAWPYSHPTSLVPAPAGCAVVFLRVRVNTCQPQTIPCMSRPPNTPNCTHALRFSSLGLEVLLRCWRCRF